MDWALRKKLQQRLAAEQGYYIFPAGTRTRCALVYPNSYYVGMSNLGLHVIYDLLNRRGDVACERAFQPDRQEQARYLLRDGLLQPPGDAQPEQDQIAGGGAR